jgi:DNA polymerase III alpha subunit
VSVVPPDQLETALTSGIPLESLAVTELTAEVRRLNQLTDSKLTVKTELNRAFPPAWTIPEAYQKLDVESYVMGLKVAQDELYEQRINRLAEELLLFEAHGLFDVLRLLIYLVDELKKAKAVWGVGRGSSCSSYVLYLIGLHAVDPVKYDVDIKDFIR